MTEYEINMLMATGFGFGSLYWFLFWYVLLKR